MFTAMDRVGGEAAELRLARLEIILEWFKTVFAALEDKSNRLAERNAELEMEIHAKESERADLKLQFHELTATNNALECKNKELEEQVLNMDNNTVRFK